MPKLCCQKLYKKISNILFFNFIISFTLESFLELCLVILLNLTSVISLYLIFQFCWETNGDKAALLVSIILAMYLLFLFLMTVFIITRRRNRLYEESYLNTVGDLYNAQKKEGKWASAYQIFFMLRRAIFAFIMIFLGDFPFF